MTDKTDNKELVAVGDLLPAIANQSKQIEQIKEILNNLQKDNKNTYMESMDIMPLDFRKLDGFFALQQAYYNIFAKNQASLELVPFEIIQKADNWATKMFKKDLDKQINKGYKKLIKKEKKEKRQMKFKEFIKKLFKPFKRKAKKDTNLQPRQAD